MRRVRTNTLLQSLTTLNDPFFFAAARAMAERMWKEGGSTEGERATYGFRLSVARKPAQPELDSILKFYNQQLEHYKQNTTEAYQTLAAKAGSVEHAPELAAWTMVANVLLNMDETITKE